MSIWRDVQVNEFNFVQVSVVDEQLNRLPTSDRLEFCLLCFVMSLELRKRVWFENRAAADAK